MEIFGCEYNTGWQNVIRSKQNTAMCTVEIESGLGYKSSQVRVQVRVQQKWTEVRTRILQVCFLLLLYFLYFIVLILQMACAAQHCCKLICRLTISPNNHRRKFFFEGARTTPAQHITGGE